MGAKKNPKLLDKALPRKPSMTEDLIESRFSTILGAARGETQQDIHRPNEVAQLREENEWLKRELVYITKLESANRKLLQEVQVTSALLRAAVLEHRREQKALDREFLQDTRF
jgi:hypothetical protein